MSLCICPHCGYDLADEEVVADGLWRFEPRRGIFYGGTPVLLGPSRTLLLGALMRAKGRVLSKAALLGVVGAEDSESNLIDCQISKARQILLREGVPCPIETVWGCGFRWDSGGDHAGQRPKKIAA